MKQWNMITLAVTIGLFIGGNGISSAQADIVSGLAQYLAMDDGSGTTATDSSGNGDNGTLTINSSGVGAGFTTGYIGGGVKLWEQSGATDYLTLNPTPANANWASAGARTLSMWFNVEQASTFNRFILYIKNADNKIYAYTKSDGNLVLRVQENGGDDYNLDIGTSVSTNEWHNVIMTFGGGTSPAFYFDGTLISSTSLTPDPQFSSGSQLAGSDGGGLFGIRGTIDEFRVYNRILTSTVDGSNNLNGGDLFELYNYTGAVPEPASMVICLASGALVLMRRKRG